MKDLKIGDAIYVSSNDVKFEAVGVITEIAPNSKKGNSAFWVKCITREPTEVRDVAMDFADGSFKVTRLPNKKLQIPKIISKWRLSSDITSKLISKFIV